MSAINERVSPETLDKIIEAADEVITALAGTNEDVHKDDSAKMCQLWDDLNDRYATPAIVKAMARELQQYRAAAEPVCPKCGGTGMADSGGFQPWGEPILIECDCHVAPQLPQPASENIAMQNFRTAMEGIGHIRRTLEETFGGMHGTHVEPDALVECKAICDAICEAYRGTAPQVTSVPEEVPESLKDRLITICDLVEDNDEYCQDIWNACRATMLNGGKS